MAHASLRVSKSLKHQINSNKKCRCFERDICWLTWKRLNGQRAGLKRKISLWKTPVPDWVGPLTCVSTCWLTVAAVVCYFQSPVSVPCGPWRIPSPHSAVTCTPLCPSANLPFVFNPLCYNQPFSLQTFYSSFFVNCLVRQLHTNENGMFNRTIM